MSTDGVAQPPVRLFPECSRDRPLGSQHMRGLRHVISAADIGLSDSLAERGPGEELPEYAWCLLEDKPTQNYTEMDSTRRMTEAIAQV